MIRARPRQRAEKDAHSQQKKNRGNGRLDGMQDVHPPIVHVAPPFGGEPFSRHCVLPLPPPSPLPGAIGAPRKEGGAPYVAPVSR